MSWSVSALGKPAAVAAKLAKDFVSHKCNEPEETVRQAVATAVATALKAYPSSSAVRVEASGSQNGNGPNDVVNTLTVKIEQVYGFIE